MHIYAYVGLCTYNMAFESCMHNLCAAVFAYEHVYCIRIMHVYKFVYIHADTCIDAPVFV